MRRTAEILHAQGFSVVGLRLPGHGTAPSMLARAEVKDWVAAVRIAYQHLLTMVDDECRSWLPATPTARPCPST